MPQMDVTSAPAEVPVTEPGLLVLQNIGTGAIYFGHTDDIDETTGMKIASGASYEYARAGFGGVFVMSDTTADLRWLSY